MPVYQKNGNWYMQFMHKGQRYHRALPDAKTKKEAQEAEMLFKASLLQGKDNSFKKNGEILFRDLADMYIDYTKVNNLSWKGNLSRLKVLLDFFGNKKLKDITPIFIEQYRQKRKDIPKRNGKPRTPTAINREIEVLRKMFNIAIDNNLLESNPCCSKKIKKLRENTKKERFLDKEEETTLLSLCIGEFAYMKPIIICALQTGMRKGEILNLKWDYVDFNKGFITVTKTKSGKDRKIPISSALMPILEMLNKSKSSEYVFVNPETNQPYHDLKRAFPSLCKKAGIKGLVFHDLRHTAATRMVAAGIDLIVVKDILGHADVRTTMRYAHPVPERKLMAVEALANY